MNDAQGSDVGNLLRRGWRVARWPLGILVVAYIALLVWRAPSYMSEQKSKEAVAFIQSRHLTLADVDGKHLPPPPDPKLVDATVEGIDANQNGIRDDVELAIFKKYPNSPYTRAAELQYAMAEQMFLDGVRNSEAWAATAIQDSRAYACVSESYSRMNAEVHGAVIDQRINEVKDLVLNTQSRKSEKNSASRYATSVGLPDRDFCDVDPSNLQN
ncbi:MAG: hypothetical protein WC050_04035 [Candidatus Paceibacterota bacterium]